MTISPTAKTALSDSATSKELLDCGALDCEAALQKAGSCLDGLTVAEAAKRLEQYGPNQMAREKRVSWLARFWDNLKNPLVILLTGLAVVSYLTGDIPGASVIIGMVVLGVVLRFYQETIAPSVQVTASTEAK